jgi:protoporphyrinogen oxidase
METAMAEVVVIGAGPAGLTAAYELTKLGLRATVLEADDYVGGLSRTVNYRGYRFDIGGHRFFSKVPLIHDLWREILGEDFLVRPRLSRIYYRGRFFDYPLKPGNALFGLGPVEALRILLSYAKAQVSSGGEEANFEQWVSKRFGSRLYEIFFKTYTEKVWGMPCTEISADWAAQRIKNLSLHEALRNAVFGNGQGKDGHIITTLIDQFHYPRFGPGMMWERCAALLAARGGETLRGIRVDRIRHRCGRVESVYGHTRTGEMVVFNTDHVISTMPLCTLVHILEPTPPDEVIRAANRLRYRDYLTVVLIVKRQEVFQDNWIYVHAPEVKVGRIQNYKNWSPDMVPDPTRTSLGLEYFLWNNDAEWNWPQERLIELGVEECARIGLIVPDEVEDGTVVRMQKAYPIYDRQYHAGVAVVRQYLGEFSNLQTIGRNGLHRYNNQDHSMLTGVYAARNITGEQYDVWAVNTEQEYQEEARVAVTGGDRLVPTYVAPSWATFPEASDEVIDEAFAELDPLALGLAVGMVSGLGLFLATVVLLLAGGSVVGATLSLLGHYLVGFKVSWAGAFIGLLEGGGGGFVLGYLGAWIKNEGIAAYAALLKRRVDAEVRRDLLDRV